MVEVEGVGPTDGPRLTKPPACCPVTVRLPAIATALAGMPPRPVIWNVLGAPAVNTPMPAGLFARVSSRRTGVIAVKVVSVEWRVIESLLTADQWSRPSFHCTYTVLAPLPLVSVHGTVGA